MYPELQNDGWWCILVYLCDITEKLNSLNRNLQGENNIVSQMANKVFAFEEKLNIYHDEIQNKQLQNFPTMIKTTEDHIDISEENCAIISNYITALLDQFRKRFQDLRKIKKCLLLVENPWHLETTTISELASVLNCHCIYSELFVEFIDFKNDTNLEVLFKGKKGNTWNFGALFPKNIKASKELPKSY